MTGEFAREAVVKVEIKAGSRVVEDVENRMKIWVVSLLVVLALVLMLPSYGE